ncbi:type II secretion system protein [Pseudogulbenkiania sp. MAI-1]|uniref:type II secretion system protein n=1 Tax=Pseudogulbenkiania sp. MAI-1 TaxID=990370 RepID=UPI0004B927B0|nr:type II secretion system protein [Pseudogulbenkiania sp. MAI-1]
MDTFGRRGRYGMGGAGGFTLIEMIVTVLIVALLASIALPMAELAVQREKEQELRLALRQIREGIDAYKKAVDEGRIPKAADESGYPKTLEILVEGVPDPKDPDKKKKYYFLRRLPRDPMARDDGTVGAADTWGKRSYASPPDAPEEGDDVFDVYSRSEGRGLNGVPYRQW